MFVLQPICRGCREKRLGGAPQNRYTLPDRKTGPFAARVGYKGVSSRGGTPPGQIGGGWIDCASGNVYHGGVFCRRPASRVSLALFPGSSAAFPAASQAACLCTPAIRPGMIKSNKQRAALPASSRKRASRSNAAVEETAGEPAVDDSQDSGSHDSTNGNGNGDSHAPSTKRRRATAESMAASQRDISVSEFFAKNRHLLGFDNPRKALLTTIKEAVDNSLDACEEAGILPEIWVHIEQTGAEPLQGRRAGQRPGHRQDADPQDLRQAALRLEVSSPADEPRPAGHRHQRRRHVRRADHRQAGEDHLAASAQASRPITSKSRSTPRRTSPRFSTARAKGSTFRPARPAQKSSRSTASNGWKCHTARASRSNSRPSTSAAAAASTNIWNRRPIANPHVTLHYKDPDGSRARLSARPPKRCRPSPRRSSRIPTASSWACW